MCPLLEAQKPLLDSVMSVNRVINKYSIGLWLHLLKSKAPEIFKSFNKILKYEDLFMENARQT